MKLIEYLSERGMQIKLAESLGLDSSVLVNQWAHETRPVPAERCPEIEKATHGAVSCEELRPDLMEMWAYLSSRKRKAN